MKGLTTCFWFDGSVAEAAKFYTSVFRSSNEATVIQHGDAEPHDTTEVVTGEFEVNGQKFYY